MHERQREHRLQRLQRQIQHGVIVNPRHLRFRIHDRGAGLVLHVLAGDDGADLLPEGLNLRVVGFKRLDRRHRDLGRKL